MTKERIIVNSSKILGLMKTRSSIRRIGLDVCMSAGLGDVGYSDYWTMELSAIVRDSGRLWSKAKRGLLTV